MIHNGVGLGFDSNGLKCNISTIEGKQVKEQITNIKWTKNKINGLTEVVSSLVGRN